MNIRAVPFVIIISLVSIGNPPQAVAQKNRRIERTQIDGAISIVFRDEVGRVIKTISRPTGEAKENGRRVQREIQVLVNESSSRVVLGEERRDMDEKNPYVIRRSSAVHLSWYDGEGKLLCSIRTRMKPKFIANKGQALIATETGIEPTMFERLHDVPGLNSIDQLRNDKSLTNSFLYVLNDSCQVAFSTMSAKGGWETALISTSGIWILLAEAESGTAIQGGGWRNVLTAINTRTGKAFIIDWDRDISPKTISDEGAVLGEKYLGPGSVYAYRLPNGQERKARRRRLQQFEWTPGSSAFVSKGQETEEK